MSHSAKCIEQALASIDQNNLDTLAERGINERLAGLDTDEANRLLNAELAEGLAAGTLSPVTEAKALEWLAEGILSCYCEGYL